VTSAQRRARKQAADLLGSRAAARARYCAGFITSLQLALEKIRRV